MLINKTDGITVQWDYHYRKIPPSCSQTSIVIQYWTMDMDSVRPRVSRRQKQCQLLFTLLWIPVRSPHTSVVEH